MMCWPDPIRLDVGDDTTWPPEGEMVLSFYSDGWGVTKMYRSVRPLRWLEYFGRDGGRANTGDYWLPLPPRPGGEG
jgi:hypothetical protein